MISHLVACRTSNFTFLWLLFAGKGLNVFTSVGLGASVRRLAFWNSRFAD